MSMANKIWARRCDMIYKSWLLNRCAIGRLHSGKRQEKTQDISAGHTKRTVQTERPTAVVTSVWTGGARESDDVYESRRLVLTRAECSCCRRPRARLVRTAGVVVAGVRRRLAGWHTPRASTAVGMRRRRRRRRRPTRAAPAAAAAAARSAAASPRP